MDEYPPPQRDERGRLLPGSVANPKGRPAIVREVREWCQEFMSVEGWAKVAEIIRDEKTRADARLAALRLVAEYGYGKPSQKVELDTGSREIIVNLVPGPPAPPAADE